MTRLAKVRELGLNLLRCHITIPDEAYLDAADEAGLLVWCELPNWNRFSPTAAATGLAMLTEMVEALGNHPSIVAWTIINEDWGTDLRRVADHRRWLADAYEHLRQLDPTRLIVDNSACGGPGDENFHVRSDLADFHVYSLAPDHAAAWRDRVADYATRPDWLWSPEGDAAGAGRRAPDPLGVRVVGAAGPACVHRARRLRALVVRDRPAGRAAGGHGGAHRGVRPRSRVRWRRGPRPRDPGAPARGPALRDRGAATACVDLGLRHHGAERHLLGGERPARPGPQAEGVPRPPCRDQRADRRRRRSPPTRLARGRPDPRARDGVVVGRDGCDRWPRRLGGRGRRRPGRTVRPDRLRRLAGLDGPGGRRARGDPARGRGGIPGHDQPRAPGR